MTPRPWLKAYPPGTDWRAPLRTTALTTVLDEAVIRWPQRTALRFEGAELSYAQLDQACDRLARALIRLGVRPGSHVGLYLPNTPTASASACSLACPPSSSRWPRTRRSRASKWPR